MGQKQDVYVFSNLGYTNNFDHYKSIFWEWIIETMFIYILIQKK